MSTVRINYSVELAFQVNQPGADFLFNVQAARTPRQLILNEHLQLEPGLPVQEYTDPQTATRLLRLRCDGGPLLLRYKCEVELQQALDDPSRVPETWVCNLPGAVLPYLYPSRFCESDVLNAFAMRQFGGMWQGYSRAQAVCDWVRDNVAFESGSSSVTMTAADTLSSRKGVCRDFAHLMIALCRAVNMPARFATGLDYGADPALGPTDFHAYVEVYLGTRWYIFDPSGTSIPRGLVRLATGRDASDCSYASIFGDVTPVSRWLTVQAHSTSDGSEVGRSVEAVSTDDSVPA